jgi:NodT family efflux transporter outer membrane factor (OMF) lipoprotein
MIFTNNRIFLFGPLLLATTLALTACATVGQDYRRPDLQVPASWQAPQTGKLTDLTNWWETFNDATLDSFLEATQKDNPTLAKAAAAIDKARANRASVDAGFLPQVNASAAADWSGSLKNGTNTSRAANNGLDSSWEIDLFGKNRRSAESAGALAQAREADWHDARVSLAAEVAGTYIDYRACWQKEKYYLDQADSQAKTSYLTQLSATAGFTAPADARLAEASAASTRSTALAQKTECEVLVKSLVALTGMDEPSVRRQLGQGISSLPQPESLAVSSVPADLVRQRPDIVSAEGTLASTSAQVGVAEAGRYPSLSLSGSISLSASSASPTMAPWSFGPTLSLPLFTGGKTEASIRSAKADYDSALADYKQVVRTAVKEVEQSLVRLDSMAQREQEAGKSAEGYRAYLVATEQNWRVGGASMLDLETARRSTISADISLLELQQSRLQYWIALYKAMGGGWKEQNGGTK